MMSPCRPPWELLTFHKLTSSTSAAFSMSPCRPPWEMLTCHKLTAHIMISGQMPIGCRLAAGSPPSSKRSLRPSKRDRLRVHLKHYTPPPKIAVQQVHCSLLQDLRLLHGGLRSHVQDLRRVLQDLRLLQDVQQIQRCRVW